MATPEVEHQGASQALSSSPLSSVQDPDLPDYLLELPPVEDMKLYSPSQDKDSSLALNANPLKANSPPKKKVLVKRARKSKWDAENILSDPKSPLASAELRTVLASPMAWDVLDLDEKAEILALFPDNQHILSANTNDARPDFVSLRNDDGFRYDCAAYTHGLAQGKHDPEWLASAWCAHERRKMGEFDEYLETKFKEEWDVELPEELRPRRQITAAKKNDTMTQDGEKKQANGHDDKTKDEIMTEPPRETTQRQRREDPNKKDGDEDHIMSKPQKVMMNGSGYQDKKEKKDDATTEPRAVEGNKANGQKTNREIKFVVEILGVGGGDTTSVPTDVEHETTTVRRPRRRTRKISYIESDTSEDELG